MCRNDVRGIGCTVSHGSLSAVLKWSPNSLMKWPILIPLQKEIILFESAEPDLEQSSGIKCQLTGALVNKRCNFGKKSRRVNVSKEAIDDDAEKNASNQHWLSPPSHAPIIGLCPATHSTVHTSLCPPVLSVFQRHFTPPSSPPSPPSSPSFLFSMSTALLVAMRLYTATDVLLLLSGSPHTLSHSETTHLSSTLLPAACYLYICRYLKLILLSSTIYNAPNASHRLPVFQRPFTPPTCQSVIHSHRLLEHSSTQAHSSIASHN